MRGVRMAPPRATAWTAAGYGDDGEVRASSEHEGESSTCHGLVVDQHDAQPVRHGGSLRSVRVAVWHPRSTRRARRSQR